jgi:hypothetical protein
MTWVSNKKLIKSKVKIIVLLKYKLKFLEFVVNLSGMPKNNKISPISKIKVSISIGT